MSQVTLDGLVAYYKDKGASPQDIRAALKLSKEQYNGICWRNRERLRTDPEGQKELVDAVKAHFAKPVTDGNAALDA